MSEPGNPPVEEDRSGPGVTHRVAAHRLGSAGRSPRQLRPRCHAARLARLILRRGSHCTDRCTRRRYTRRDRQRAFDLLLDLSAKRAGEISFAAFAAAALPGADVAVESVLSGGCAHAEVAEHTPGTRTRIKRQRGEQVLGAHVAAPGLLGNRGRTLQSLHGLGRHQRRPLAGRRRLRQRTARTPR